MRTQNQEQVENILAEITKLSYFHQSFTSSLHFQDKQEDVVIMQNRINNINTRVVELENELKLLLNQL